MAAALMVIKKDTTEMVKTYTYIYICEINAYMRMDPKVPCICHINAAHFCSYAVDKDLGSVVSELYLKSQNGVPSKNKGCHELL